MIHWRYEEPDENGNSVQCTFSEYEILEAYREIFLCEMEGRGMQRSLFTDEDIIDEWVVINWATKV